MYIPSRFQPSSVNRLRMYNPEGKLLEVPVPGSRAPSPGLADANSLYATDAERFGSVAPFLLTNKLKDAKRRNYVIQPGGACLYFEEEKQLKDAFGGGRVQYTAPSDQESFGHNTEPGGYYQGTVDPRFSVGRADGALPSRGGR